MSWKERVKRIERNFIVTKRATRQGEKTMNEKPVTQALARRFLLGQVDGLERQEIENLFITDPDIKNTILLAEEDLVEEYLDGRLSQSEVIDFLGRHGQTSYQRRKLRIAESLRQYAVANALSSQSPMPGILTMRNLVSFPVLRNSKFLMSVSLAVMMILLATSVWLVSRYTRRAPEIDLNRELTELNTPSNLNLTLPHMYSLPLPPLSFRSVQPPSQVTLGDDYRIIELQLIWPHKEESQRYQASFLHVGSPGRFTVFNLHLEHSSGGSIVRVRLPAEHVAPGLYQVSLSGNRNDGSQLIEEYTFTVTR
jgi:hypothetical protein